MVRCSLNKMEDGRFCDEVGGKKLRLQAQFRRCRAMLLAFVKTDKILLKLVRTM